MSLLFQWSGFTLGVDNTWANGGGFINGLGAGLARTGTGICALSGIKSLVQGNNFWTGVPKSGAGITYNKLDVERPSLGSEFPQRELAKVEMGSAVRNPTAGPSSLGNNTIDTGNLRIDLEMGRGGFYPTTDSPFKDQVFEMRTTDIAYKLII